MVSLKKPFLFLREEKVMAGLEMPPRNVSQEIIIIIIKTGKEFY